MRIRPIALAFVVACGVAPASTSGLPDGWKTYRSDEFGYAFSFPATMDLRTTFGGQRGTLVDTATGERLVELEVWPPGLCPPQPEGMAPRRLGMERATVMTQADGPDGSSACDEPAVVRDAESSHGARYWELMLRCSDGGTKGPTFVADVSQPWRVRVLVVDPVGVDPRQPSPTLRVDPAVVREILATLATVAVPRPLVGRRGEGIEKRRADDGLRATVVPFGGVEVPF